MKQNDENIDVKTHEDSENTAKSKQKNIILKFFIKLSKNLFLLFLMIVISSLYYIYLFWNIVPMLQSSKTGLTYKFWERENLQDNSYCFGIFYLIFFHYNFTWFIICLIKTSCSDPGEIHLDYLKSYTLVPIEKLRNNGIILKDNVEKYVKTLNFRHNTKSKFNRYLQNESSKLSLKSSFLAENEKKNIIDDSLFDEDKLENLSKNNIYDTLKTNENKENRIPRTCRFCIHVKSDRMHHCRSCGKCFLKSDHHCYFINNCIGFKNYKSFFCFLFYSLLLLIFISITMLNGLKNCLIENGIDSINFLGFSITYALAIITLFSTLYLFILHVFFISKNITTIEYLEKYKKKPKLIEKNPYNLGVLNNFKLVLGNNFWMWLFPFTDDYKSLEGYEFKSKEK